MDFIVKVENNFKMSYSLYVGLKGWNRENTGSSSSASESKVELNFTTEYLTRNYCWVCRANQGKSKGLQTFYLCPSNPNIWKLDL